MSQIQMKGDYSDSMPQNPISHFLLPNAIKAQIMFLEKCDRNAVSLFSTWQKGTDKGRTQLEDTD